MPDDAPRVYWDANVFLSYINGVTDRLPVIDELLRRSRAREIELLTSALSRVEVAYAQTERDQRALDPEVEQKIDNSWAPGSPVKPVEFYDLIGDRAKRLMRRGSSRVGACSSR